MFKKITSKFNQKLIFLLLVLIVSSALKSKTMAFERSVYLDSYKGLQTVLSSKDLSLYHEAYNKQKEGDFKGSDLAIEQISDKILLGYIYYVRYSSNNYSPTNEELASWLNNYQDLAVAPLVYRMIDKKKYNKSKLPKPKSFYNQFTPIYNTLAYLNNTMPTINSITTAKPTLQNNYITKKINSLLKTGQTSKVASILNSQDTKKKLNQVTYDYYNYLLGKNYFLDGANEKAIYWLKKSLKNNPSNHPESTFTIGLAYYKLKNYSEAQKYFAMLFLGNEMFSTHYTSKSSYWYARASLSLNQIDNYYKGLQIAAQYLYNFYGLIASEELGLEPQYNWNFLELSKSSSVTLLENIHGKRALALLQLGLLDWAEQELIFLFLYDLDKLNQQQQQKMATAILFFAQNIPMPALSYKIAGDQGKYYGFSHLNYPLLPVDLYQTAPGINPLLITALIKRESTFLTGATSSVGATGLMQMLPKTAEFVVKKYNLNPSLANNYYLTSPRSNIEIGNKYVTILLENPDADRNLIYILAGFNAGFIKVKKWKEQNFRNPDDPLMFIESIPYYETRNYVKSVLTDFWVYHYKVGIKPTSLSFIVQGAPPFYTNLTPEENYKIINFQYAN